MTQHFLYTEKYRPKTVADTILPEEIKATFQAYVDKGSVPNLLLSGPAGTGKTTIAKAMLNELDADYIVINGSLNGNIDTLRTDIQQFASSQSLSANGRKYVIFDEADFLTAATQPALRNFMEEFAKNCGFILTCNYRARVLKEIQSRCAVVEFRISPEHKAPIAAAMFGRACTILDSEGIKYDKRVVAEIVKTHFPDFRRVLNELQQNGSTGEISSSILSSSGSEAFERLAGFLKEKNFTAVRKWVAETNTLGQVDFYRQMYDTLSLKVQQSSVPPLVLILADYAYKSAFVADQEINTTACCVEIMSQCVFQ